MLDLDSAKGRNIARAIEIVMTLDLAGVGLIGKICDALQKRQRRNDEKAG